ncbi:LysR family transcriptional regulator [Alphaproteobacteria bacterium HT1-32]|nr:LysR family transcriptional regulator [Alphaproteobacteria bacterium HT1-32]|tara:strand:+ start:15906 stop:16787 length:882 start_codon:yes stop_codon:yes gene_type:complete
MNHAQLRAFHQVATEGSFTKAAAALRVTQPTISAQVKGLEDSYGIRLFDRRGRGIELTDLGETLLQITRRLFDLEEQAAELLTANRALEGGHLKIGIDSPMHVTPILTEFVKRFPGITIGLSTGNSDKVLHDLLDYRTDIAVVARLQVDDRLVSIVLREDHLVVFMRSDHPLAGRKGINLTEIAQERLILRESGSVTRQIFEEALDRAEIVPHTIMEMDSREAVREAVSAGLGIGIVSNAEIGEAAGLAILDIQNADVGMTEYLVCLRERRRLRIVRAFMDLSREIRDRATTG